MLTNEIKDIPTKVLVITDDQYLTTAIRSFFKNVQQLKSNNIINYITGEENENHIVLVDERCGDLKILKYRNISRENDFLIILRQSSKEKKEESYHYETIIELSESTVCFCNRLKKHLYIFSKKKISSFQRSNTLTNIETTIIKLLCMKKKPKEIAKIKGLSLASTYRHIENIVKKYGYKKFHYMYDDILKEQDIL